jgi:hypothetical protein
MRVFTKRITFKIVLLTILAFAACVSACSQIPAPSVPADGGKMPGQTPKQGGPPPQEMDTGVLNQGEGGILPDIAQPPLAQDAPSMPDMEVITVELDTIVSQELLRSLPTKCTNLDGILLAVVNAADPVELAQALNMPVKNDKIQVMLVLDSAEVSFLKDFGVEVGKQSGDQVQAYVPIARMCDLAADERIQALYHADQAVIQQ